MKHFLVLAVVVTVWAAAALVHAQDRAPAGPDRLRNDAGDRHQAPTDLRLDDHVLHGNYPGRAVEMAPVADPPEYTGLIPTSSPPEWLYGFEIDRDAHLLLRYELPDVEEIAERYRRDGMRWFYPRHKPSLFFPYLDSNLIPLREYSFGFARNPVLTSQAALAFYTSYLDTGSDVDLRGFLNNVNWLIDHLDQEFYLRYEFEWVHGGVRLDSGWVSAMAQGEALAALSSAYFLTGEQQYLDAAAGLFETLHSNSETTWSILLDPYGYYWLEEYPTADLCHVLNGMLFGLWGLWDYYVLTDDLFALELFEAGIRTIVDHHPIWNLHNRNASRYCLHGLEYPFYHETHIRQFAAYLNYFDIPEFAAAIELFTREPKIDVSAHTLQFGEVSVGLTSREELVIWNEGTGNLRISEITTPSDVFVPGFSDTTIAAGDSTILRVMYTPLVAGFDASVMQIESEAGTISIDLEGTGMVYDVAAEEEGDLPRRFELEAAYPNPFNTTTRVEFSVPRVTDVRITVIDIAGRAVRSFHHSGLPAGHHALAIDLSGLPAGLYYCRMAADGFQASTSLVFVP